MSSENPSNGSPVISHKTLTLYDKLIFENAVIRPPFSTPAIMPDEACFLYIKNGTNQVYSETATETIRSREAVLMKCGNFVGSLIPSQNDGVYEAVAVHFYPDMLRKVYENEVPSILTNTPSGEVSQMARIATDRLIEKYIESLMFYFQNPALVTEELLVLKVKELILLLSKTENGSAVRQILGNLFSPVSVSFKEIIEAHIYTRVTIQDLATLTNMSVSSFKREFERLFDDSPASYIRNRKLRRAAELLLASEENISNIAWDCGFQDITHFSRLFKKHYGFSPRKYRSEKMV